MKSCHYFLRKVGIISMFWSNRYFRESGVRVFICTLPIHRQIWRLFSTQ